MNSPRFTQGFTDNINEFNTVVTLAIDGDRKALQQKLDDPNGLNVVDEHGRSATLAVTILDRLEALRLLIDLGVDVDYFDPQLSSQVIDQTAFLYAGATGNNEALDLLIKAGANPEILNYYGGTALIPAAEKGHLETVRMLLDKTEINVNHVNNLGWTALMEAVILSDGGPVQQQIVKLLLANGADPDIPDNQGMTVQEHALNMGYSAIHDLLLKSG